MSEIVKRLKASIAMDVINGDSFERSIFKGQVLEAVNKIEQLERELARYKHNAELQSGSCYITRTVRARHSQLQRRTMDDLMIWIPLEEVAPPDNESILIWMVYSQSEVKDKPTAWARGRVIDGSIYMHVECGWKLPRDLGFEVTHWMFVIDPLDMDSEDIDE